MPFLYKEMRYLQVFKMKILNFEPEEKLDKRFGVTFLGKSDGAIPEA